MISDKIKRVLKSNKIERIINEIEIQEDDDLMIKIKTRANEMFKKGFKGKKE